MNEKELLIDLVNIKSQRGISNIGMINYLKKLFVGHNIKEVIHSKDNVPLYNLIVKIEGSNNLNKPPIIFVMHTDTVIGEWFQKHEESNSRIIGLGSCDMKGGITSACCAVLKKIYDRDLYLIFTSDEESGGYGGKLIKETFKLDKKAIVIVTEPTSKKIFTSQNSCVGYQVDTSGIPKHASLSTFENNLNNNAIYKMFLISNFLMDYEKKSDKLHSQNIGYINGGTSSNIVSETCKMKFEQRFKPGVNIKRKAEETISSLYNLNAKNIKISFFGESFSNENISLLDKIENLVSSFFEIEFATFTAWSEAGTFDYLGDCIIFGPGEIEMAHKNNESIDIKEVEIFTEIYSKLIEKL
ncbi:MAG: M20/M25/M40 family metallo-hydrolase [Nanoarchaeota archaeon]|nr:M20/M25/M40 family metallo-hydrolase [Nanoarchaeota archaeon]